MTAADMEREVDQLLAEVDALRAIVHEDRLERIIEICSKYRQGVMLSAIVRMRGAERRRS